MDPLEQCCLAVSFQFSPAVGFADHLYFATEVVNHLDVHLNFEVGDTTIFAGLLTICKSGQEDHLPTVVFVLIDANFLMR